MSGFLRIDKKAELTVKSDPSKNYWRVGFYLLGLLLAGFGTTSLDKGFAQPSKTSGTDEVWIDEIEKIFVPSEQCKQCHDRHYEEWKGMREQTPDLKTFGRVDGALLHGTALKSKVFRTVLGLWLQTNPTPEEKTRCLACHAPAVTVFPQHTEKIINQVMGGRKSVKVEGIGCSACHLINGVKDGNDHPSFTIQPGPTLFGPYSNPDENLVHPSEQNDVYHGANYCASCHFSKVKDVTRKDLVGEILKGTICQDCHMEQSTGSSTLQKGSLTRPIGRHWFQGIVIPGIMLSNRNLQAEWFPRVDLEVEHQSGSVKGKVLVRNGSLPHMFPGGDPVLKQFYVMVTLKDVKGNILKTERKRFGLDFDQILRGPIPRPLVNGGVTRRIPFSFEVGDEAKGGFIEAVLSYGLIPDPGKDLQEKYLSSITNKRSRKTAEKIIEEYSAPRLLTYRTKTL